MPTRDFLVQATWEHISKRQGQQPQSSVRTEHEAQLLLLYIFTHMWQNFQQGVWIVTPLWLLVSSTSNIITLLWCKPSKVQDIKAYIPSVVQRGSRNAAILIPYLSYRLWGEWSHHTQPIYPKETRYSMWRRLDRPQGQHEWEWWKSLAPMGFEPPSDIPATLYRLLKPSKV